jgi:hypothetical protein
MMAAEFPALPCLVQMACSSVPYVQEVCLVPLYVEERYQTPFAEKVHLSLLFVLEADQALFLAEELYPLLLFPPVVADAQAFEPA